jgi:hypothetical protein
MGTASLFEGIAEDGHAVEGAVVVDSARELGLLPDMTFCAKSGHQVLRGEGYSAEMSRARMRSRQISGAGS